MAPYKRRYSSSVPVVADELQWLSCITGVSSISHHFALFTPVQFVSLVTYGWPAFINMQYDEKEFYQNFL